MKLHIVPASRGVQWVKSGIQTFLKQPLALAGLFFMLLAVMTVIQLVPIVGNLAALVLMPAATMGLIAASREASNGKFPMPLVLVAAFRTGRQQLRSMLTLGAVYALCFVLIVSLTPLIDGGTFAKLMLLGEVPTAKVQQETGFTLAMLFASTLNTPLTVLFCLASALVHWHETPAMKSLFFGLNAIIRNFGAFVVYGLVWMSVVMGFAMIMAIFVAMLGSVEAASAFIPPIGLLIIASLFVSIYFIFLDSFEFTPGDDT